MKVILMAHTPDPDWVCTTAGRTCYSKLPMHDIEQGEKGCEKWLKDKVERGHESVLEHATFTFSIEGVSRSLTHQLVRHRLASYSQQSQRYVDMADFKVVIPPTVLDAMDAENGIGTVTGAWKNAMDFIEIAYNAMVAAGIPKEDARYVLPNAACTNIVVTMNGRELRHFLKLRLCNAAQWEIRELAAEMEMLAKEVAPGIMSGAGPDCRHCPTKCGSPVNAGGE